MTEPTIAQNAEKRPKVKKGFIITILVLALISISYRLLLGSDYGQTSALYVGIPALFAIGLSFIPTPHSITGRILLWTTLTLLAFGVLAIEGIICIIIVLPFFLAIGFIVGIFMDRARAREELAKTRLSLLLVLALPSLEGTHQSLSFNRSETVTVERSVNLSAQELQERLQQGPRFDTDSLPFFLRAGFPTPQNALGNQSLELGTRWTIPFDHGEEHPRNLVVQISGRTPDSLTLVPVQDDTEMGKWMTWEKVTWQWEEVEQGKTLVKVTFEFHRDLDPAFYFGPVQRFGVKQAGGYFLDSIVRL